MIAKAATISHGGNAVRYSVNKDSKQLRIVPTTLFQAFAVLLSKRNKI